MAADGWFATGMIRFARSRQESVRSKCKSRRPAIAPLRASAFASRRTSCPNGRAAPRASTPFYPFSICVGFPPAISRRRSPPCSARTRQTFPRRDRAPQERMGGRISAMAEARFVGAPLRLRLGGRRLFADAHGAAGRMHAGADGGDAGGQEGADRLSDGHAGERAKLEGAARRFEG